MPLLLAFAVVAGAATALSPCALPILPAVLAAGATGGRRRPLGVVNPVSEPFCADCNRIRLTAEGKLRTCLFSLHETDLRDPMRAGAADDELERIIRDAVWRKELKHHVGERGFRQPPRTMSAIGG